MASQVQDLIAARGKIQKDAFNNGDADKLMSLFSREIQFTDEDVGMVNVPYDGVKEFYSGIFSTMSSFKVLSSSVTGTTPEFTAWELETQGVASVDIPPLKVTAGDTVRLLGVSLQWWQWEGKGSWKGDLTQESITGWKVRRQHEYFIPTVTSPS